MMLTRSLSTALGAIVLGTIAGSVHAQDVAPSSAEISPSSGGAGAPSEPALPTEFWSFCTADPGTLQPSAERLMSGGWELTNCAPYAAQVPGTLAATVGHCCYFVR